MTQPKEKINEVRPSQNVDTKAETTITPSSEGDMIVLNIDDGMEREYELHCREAQDLLDGIQLAMNKAQ
jgi:hypothetical protein